MTDQSLSDLAEELVSLGEKATPGPWICKERQARYTAHINGAALVNPDGVVVCRVPLKADKPLDQKAADLDFITFARNHAPEIARAYLDAMKVVEECAVLFEREIAAREGLSIGVTTGDYVAQLKRIRTHSTAQAGDGHE